MKVTDLVTEFAQPVVESFGCSLWDVEYVREGSERFLRLYIDKDGGVDILPIAHLSKGEVFALGAYLGVPESILNKAPSAGFFADQTDEKEK